MKRLFSVSLYREALRQSKIVAIPSCILMELIVALPIIGAYLLSQDTEATIYAATNSTQLSIISYPGAMLSFLLCFIIAPFLALYLFSFLNKRNTSDFYHSLPYTREALYFSHTAAALTYGLGIFVLAMLTSLVLYTTLMAPFAVVEIASFWWLMFTGAATIVLVTGATVLAASITGTVLTNLIVTALILFLPRFILFLFELLLDEHVLLVSRFLPFPFGAYNLVISPISALMGTPFEVIWNTPVNGIYTLCLGLLYIGLGAWTFHRRKSEAAGQSAPSRKLQTVFRLCIGLTLSLPATFSLIDTTIGHKTLDTEESFFLFVVYLFAVLAYFFYELITTRKFRSLAKAVPALGILVLLNLAAYGSGIGIHTAIVNRVPAENDIESIQIVSELDSDVDYFKRKSETIRYTDSSLCATVATSLARDAQDVKDGSYYKEIWSVQYTTHSFKINLKNGGSLYRRVRLDAKGNELLNEVRTTAEEALDIYWDIPAPEDCRVYCGDKECSAIYQTLYEERTAYPKELWVNLLQENTASPVLTYLSVSTYKDGRTEQFQIPLTSEYPKTAKQFMEWENAHLQNSLDLLNKALTASYAYTDLEIGWEDMYIAYYSENTLTSLTPFQELYAYLRSNSAIDDPTKYVSVWVSFSFWNEGEYYYNDYFSCYLPTDWVETHLAPYSTTTEPEKPIFVDE